MYCERECIEGGDGVLTEREWIDRGDDVLFHDGVEGVRIDAGDGVACEGYSWMEGYDGVLLSDGGDGVLFSNGGDGVFRKET